MYSDSRVITLLRPTRYTSVDGVSWPDCHGKEPWKGKFMDCVYCEASGTEPYTGNVCPVCEGKIELPDNLAGRPKCRRCQIKPGHEPYTFGKCLVCGGTGRIPPEDHDGPEIWHVEPTGLFKLHQNLSELFSSLTGEVCVCDKYYGTRSLARIREFQACSTLRLLTQIPDTQERAFLPTSLQDFLREQDFVQIHKYTGLDLHDRYIFTDERLIILGHGLKDIGKKESFVIILSAEMASDMIKALKVSFEEKWKRSEPLA